MNEALSKAKEALEKIALLDYANAATNCCAYKATSLAKEALAALAAQDKYAAPLLERIKELEKGAVTMTERIIELGEYLSKSIKKCEELEKQNAELQSRIQRNTGLSAESLNAYIASSQGQQK